MQLPLYFLNKIQYGIALIQASWLYVNRFNNEVVKRITH